MYFCAFLKENTFKVRAVSSAGRATGLHPVGRGFEPLTAHHLSDLHSDSA